MLDNLTYLALFAGLIALATIVLSPIIGLLIVRARLVRQARELEHIRAKHERAQEIYQERKAQGRI